MALRSKFLSFVSSRVDAALAEDILQSASIKAMEHAGEIRDEESTVAWFYRILRNAISLRWGPAGALNNPVLYQRAASVLTLNQLLTDFGRTRNMVASAELRTRALESLPPH